MRFLALLVGIGSIVGPTPTLADTISRAKLTIDATTPSSIALSGEVVWTVEGVQPRSTLDLHLVRDLVLTSVESEGQVLTFAGEDLAETQMKTWTLRLPIPVSPGASRTIQYEATLASSSVPGIQVRDDGGFLLPGSGWFPRSTPHAAERLTHSVRLVLPDGWEGVAAGSRAGEGPWTSTSPARPYAVWGAFEVEMRSGLTNDEATNVAIYRRTDRVGDAPRFDAIVRILDHLRTGVGAEAGVGDWKLIDVGDGIMAGGLRTIFWDEAAAEASGNAERDLGGAIAASFWSEHFQMRGDLAAWLSRAIDLHLGDLAVISLDASDDRTATEAAIIGARRDGAAGGKPLRGLVPVSADAVATLETRGALVAHLMAEAVPTRPRWVRFVSELRSSVADAPLTAEILLSKLKASFPAQHEFLGPFLDTVDLPDFRIASHGPQKGKLKPRYRVEVENVGSIAAYAEMGTFTSGDHPLRMIRVFVEPGTKRSVMFADLERMARVTVDPRGVTPQPSFEDETIRLTPQVTEDTTPYQPSFPFSTTLGSNRAIEDFSLDLDGVSIRSFNGNLLPYSTHHGPSGAILFGTGMVEIRPTEPKLAKSFEKEFGKPSLTFQGSEIWLRFPLAAWKTIEPQLYGAVDPEDAKDFAPMMRQIHAFSFPAYFADGNRAQIPPEGSAVVLFTDQAGERRGVFHGRDANGGMGMRYWEHLQNETLWEASE